MTLDSGQAFGWQLRGGAWEGVLAGRWVRLSQPGHGIVAETCVDPGDWSWLKRYLRWDDDLAGMVASFPPDPPLREAVEACRGLRLLRQDPWECLASFILSSTKQIVQIRQVVALLKDAYGASVPGPDGEWRAFPTAAALAAVTEADLRACRMGFRANYLLGAARAVAEQRLELESLPHLPLEEARAALTGLRGVGRKIADCVLLFSLGFDQVFPVDVWVLRCLRELYFPRRRRTAGQILAFAETHFGPRAGWAQQYLFHHVRMRAGRVSGAAPVAIHTEPSSC